MLKTILTIDQGTSSTRAVLFDSTGKILHIEQEPINTIFPENGWVEQDANELWNKTLNVVRKVISYAKSKKFKILSIGITNQRETIVAWDKTNGNVLYNAIVWQDRRTKEYCDELINNNLSAVIKNKTGLLIDPYFSASKINWILKNIEDAKQLAFNNKLAVGTIDCFILYKLTNGESFYTDATNASRTSLYNINTCKWDNELLEVYDIPISILPEVKNNIDNFGYSNSKILGEKLPINAMIGDQQSAAIGQICVNPGDIKATFGTGCFVLLNTGKKALNSKNKLITTIALKSENEISYALEGSIFVSGATMKWLKDELKIISDVRETQSLAASIKDNNGVYFVPAFTGLGAPHWRADARGTITGLTSSSGIAEIVRSSLEAVAYQCCDLFDSMKADGQIPEILRVDGAMSSNDWLMQFLSDISQKQIDRSQNIETTAQGAAILSAIGSGIIPSIQDSKSYWKLNKQFKPNMHQDDIKKNRNGWNKAIKKTIM